MSKLHNKVKHYPTTAAALKAEIKELKDFYNQRNDDFPQNRLSIFLKNELYTMNPPVGSVVSAPQPNRPFIRSGLELATLFEGETPGLWHRHVMNVLLAQEQEADWDKSCRRRCKRCCGRLSTWRLRAR